MRDNLIAALAAKEEIILSVLQMLERSFSELSPGGSICFGII
jgi:hypothetical protein